MSMRWLSSVRGNEAHPIFSWLQQRTDTSVKWNFFKFLVNKDGQPVAAFSSMTEPFDKKLIAQLESLL
jgi:glutathione peroxidase